MSEGRGGRRERRVADAALRTVVLAGLFLLVLAAGCSGGGGGEPVEPAAAPPQPTPAADPVEPLPPEAAPPPAEPVAEAPTNEAPQQAGGETPETGADRPKVILPAAGEVVRLASPRKDLTYIGAGKCRICHKTEHASWEESAHAGVDPPLDCEACHGPGSKYSKMKTMKDPEAARAAGLLDPTADFCTGACHVADEFDEGMLARAHAVKPR